MPRYLAIATRSVKQNLYVTVEAEDYDAAHAKVKKISDDDNNWETETDVGAWVTWTILPAEKAALALTGGKGRREGVVAREAFTAIVEPFKDIKDD